jgi:hypothetical protein
VSRLCAAVLPVTSAQIYYIPTAKLTRIFIICDIFSFLIQVSGSGIASSGNWKGTTVTIGTDVLIAGLATQVATFAFFMTIIIKFHLMAKAAVRLDAGNAWRKMLFAVYFSSALIIVSVMRFHIRKRLPNLGGYRFVAFIDSLSSHWEYSVTLSRMSGYSMRLSLSRCFPRLPSSASTTPANT